MHSNRFIRGAAAAAFAALIAAPAGAQSVAVFGTAEAAGFGQSLGLLGASWSPGSVGVQPVVQAMGYTLHLSGSNGSNNATVFAPSVGVKFGTPVGATSFMVGYSFANNDFGGATTATGLPAEVSDGVTTSAQWNYWGHGERSSQLIASYGFGSDYLWTQGRNAWRVGTSPVQVGGEVGLQGSTKSGSKWNVNAGPMIKVALAPAFSVDASAGLRVQTSGDFATGYGKLGFVWSPSFSK